MMARVAALALAASIAFSVQAEEAAPVELAPMQITAGRLAEPQYQVPQPVTVVTRQQIERGSPQAMADLLRGQTGIYVQSSGPGQGIPIIRGLKGSEVLHLVDGMRLNMTFFRNSPSQYIALVDPYNIEQIEVLRGPAATLYGSDAMGGVVQVLTPEHRFGGDDWAYEGGVLAQYGSADLARVGRAYAAAGTGQVSVAGGFTFQEYGRRDLGDSGREPYTGYLARGGDGKVLWSPALGHELMFGAQYFEFPRLPRYFEIVGGPGGPGPNDGLPVHFQPNDRLFLHARYRLNLPLAFVDSLEAHVGRQIVDDDRVRRVDASTREQERNRSALTGLTFQAVTTLAHGTRLVYGLDAYRDEVDSAKSRTDLTTQVTASRDSTFPDGAREGSFGAYLFAEWRPYDPWLMEAGARYSRVRTRLPETGASAAATLDNDDLSGHLSSAFELAPRLAWTVNLARGFRAPNLFDLGTLGRRPASPVDQINIPNPGLEPETIVTADTGLKWSGEAAQAELVVFSSRYRDRIESREPTGELADPDDPNCPAGGCPFVQSRNIARAEYRGVELGLRYRVAAVQSYASLTYTRGEEIADGEERPANRVPPLNGQVGAVWELDRTLFVEPYLLAAARQHRLDDDDLADVRIDPDGTPGWVTANLRLGWKPRPPYRLQLDLKNLLDKAYREHGSGVDAPGFGVVVAAAARL